MAGVVINPAPSTDMPTAPTPSPSLVSTLSISAFSDRLLAHIRGGSRNDNNNEFCRLCINLSRGIDYAVGNNVILDRAADLPNLLKQVCHWTKVSTNDTFLQTAVMVLMISIKGACRNGWFGENDNEELDILWTEIATRFCSVKDVNSGESTLNHNISTVLTRFYPRMKMGEIFAFIEAVPGYGAYVKDFHISKNAKSPNEEVYLFVAQTDNTETSACLTSPQLVNFLLNGKAVDRRNCIYKDPGPQIPTTVTDLVKCGTNLLQVVGQFNGKYIIAVAHMSMINPSFPALPDYMPPATAASDPDNDIVEGPSRVSLNCPISFKRITTPVKGHLCKHLQCFDFNNYVDINSRRPSWRCPHCSQSICFTDIRIDQFMAKVLKEVAVTISHVKISADGSWQDVNVNECDDHVDKLQDKSLLHQESNPPTDMMGVDIMDLTKGDNDIDASNSHQENEKKPSLAQLQNQPNPSGISQGQTVISGSNNMQLPTHAIRTSSTVMIPNLQGQSHAQISASSMQFQQISMNSMDRHPIMCTATTSNPPMQHSMNNRHVTRIPIAVQGLPAQTPAGMVSGDRQQQFSRFYMDQNPLVCMITTLNPSMTENINSQNWVHHGPSNFSTQTVQQFGVHSGPSHQSSGHHYKSYQHQAVNHMIPNMVQSPFVGPTVGQISNHQGQHYIGSISNQQAHHYVAPTTGSVSNQQAHHYANVAASQAFQSSGWTSPAPAPVQTSLSSIPVISSEEQRGIGQAFGTQEGSTNVQNWRPTSRMRGSLTGRAYSEALSQAILPPTQSVLAAASPPAWNTPRPFLPAHFVVANNLNPNGFQEGTCCSLLDGSGSAGVLLDN